MRGAGAALLPLALLAGGLACAPRAPTLLSPLAGALTNGELTVGSAARIEQVPASGWDLAVELDLTWRGQHRVRLDLSRTLVRVDGLTWTPCRPPAETSGSSLFVSLEPGDMQQVTLRCEDVARPHRSVEVRLHATGTGGTGVMELSYGGLDGS